MPLVHHELCFGCGRANLFGLLTELEMTAAGVVDGRCFLKQDHQGAERGYAHQGVIAAALSEAMAFVCGPEARARELQVEFFESAPVGTFLELHADAHGQRARASARVEGRDVARANGRFDR